MKKLGRSRKSLRQKRQQRHDVLFQRLEDRAPLGNNVEANPEWQEFRSIVHDMKAAKPFGNLVSLYQKQFSNENKP